MSHNAISNGSDCLVPAVLATGLQTIAAVVMGQVFRPEDKWGPLSGLMKITHKASNHSSASHFM